MWLDIVVAAALALVGAVVSWQVREYVAPMRAGDNQWFQSDLTTVWLSLTDRFFDHRRTNVHPLFPLVHTTSVYALRGLFDVGKAMAVGVWISAWASAWAVVCYAAARSLRFARRESLLIAVLMLGSASALCWTSVPETRTVGSLTILLCVIAAAASERRSVPDWVLTGVVAASMSMTLTNVIAGLALLAVTRAPRRALQLAVNAFVVVSVLQLVQGPAVPVGTVDDAARKRATLSPLSGVRYLPQQARRHLAALGRDATRADADRSRDRHADGSACSW